MQGIIFSLEYYANRKLLLSTSDDRTVAVWQFNRGNDEKEEVKLVHRFYGHDARVWKALSVHGYILSVGEVSKKLRYEIYLTKVFIKGYANNLYFNRVLTLELIF